MSSWQRDTAGRTALSTSPSPSPSSLNRLFMGGIGRVWLSGAERCERLPFLLSLLLYTEGGEGYDTRTHPPNHTHKHFFFFFYPSCCPHTHNNMRSGLAYIIHAVQTDETPMHALCRSQSSECVLHDTRTVTSCADEPASHRTDAHFDTHRGHTLRTRD